MVMVVLGFVLVVRVLVFSLVSQAEMLDALVVATRHAVVGWPRTCIGTMLGFSRRLRFRFRSGDLRWSWSWSYEFPIQTIQHKAFRFGGRT